MAGLADSAPIPAFRQFRAIGWLRLRLFVNGFRRKGGKGEVIARILIYPIALAFLLLPVAGSGFGSYFAVTEHHAEVLPIVFWGIFLLQIVVSLNIAPPGLSFDPEALIRFPLSFPRYLIIRLVLGLLSASTIAGTLSLLAAATGISLAQPDLTPWAFAAAILLAIANLLLIRTVFAWVDRWLSTRRAREAMTGLIIASSLGFQYLNMTYNTGRRGVDPMAKLAAARHVYSYGEPILARLPPGLAAGSILSSTGGHQSLALVQLVGILLFAVLFLAIFAWRMGLEYRGESLSEAQAVPASSPAVHIGTKEASSFRLPGLSPVVSACLTKELLYVRRNVSQFYALLVPLVMVFIVASRFGTLSRTGLVLPCAVAYAFLSIAALSYNSFGLDATGVQAYLLAPVPLRSVVLAKNLLTFLIASAQFLLLFVLISYLYGSPSVLITLSTLLWLVLAVFGNTAVGNVRSLSAPKKMDPAKLSRRQASQLSAFLSLGLVMVFAGIGFGLLTAASMLHLPWLPVPVLAVLAVASGVLYFSGLSRVEALAGKHREILLEELCKAS